jgi:probable DNA repair protein
MLLADILALLHDGTTLLLPNALAARGLRAAFDAEQRRLQRTTWQPAAALSWQQWTTTLWSELIVSGHEMRLLLNAAQEHALWVEVIADDPGHSSLASADALATLAHSAWQLAAAHNATPQLRASATTHDSRIFAAWAEEFSQRCATRSYLSAAQLHHALHLHTLSGNIAAPTGLHLLGFDDITPSQQLLLNTLRERGTAITLHTPTTDAPKHHTSLIAANEREELLVATHHILDLLRTNPSARVAVLVPDLAADRAELESVLRATLTPELQSIQADLSSAPWEFASGPPLASLPVVADVLSLAHMALHPQPLAGITTLLLSPYLGDANRPDAAALFDANTLRQQTLLRPELDLTALVMLDRNATLPWLRRVQLFLQREDLTKPRTCADWMQMLRGLASAANWPGPRALNASDFAATAAFDGLLDLVSTLDFAGRRVTFAAALAALERHAQTTPFAPSLTYANIQILSPADAEGSIFDAVIFLRCTDANWPPAPRPNPLLSWQLQRSLNMPGTDPALTTERTRRLTLGLLQCTPSVLFTSAAENADGQLRPSPLITELIQQGIVILSLPKGKDLLLRSMDEPVAYDLVPDTDAVPPLPQTEVHGGANLLKLQAACGFRAFAQLRLHSKELDTIDLGFDAPESGRRLHTALQLFWKQVKSQENLRALPTEVRDNILRDCIQGSLAQHLHPNGAWDSSFLAMQQQRLFTLLNAWLATELQRGPFTVLDSEQKQQIPIGPLVLDVRIDRIDSVATSAGEGFVLVDYKTGNSGHPSEWSDERGRPDEPQLPLYTLIDADDQLKGLAFAKIVAGDMKWLGYQAEDGILPASRVNQVVNLGDAVAEWRSTLEQLAYDFANGHAAVDPKEYPTTCTRCPQRILCRLDATTLYAAAEAESEASDG